MGPKTEAAIIAFQSSHGLNADGVVDPSTLAALGDANGPPPQKEWLQLLDVSAYQGVIDFNQVKAAGYTAVAIKATEGLHRRDPRFVDNWRNAKAAGVLRFAYHYLLPNLDGSTQADLFLQSLDGDLGELVPALDWETDGGVPPAAQVSQANAWFTKVDAAYARYAAKPFVYSYSSFLSAQRLPADFAARPLWLAGYAPLSQLVTPKPWTKFDIWQYRSSKTPPVPGIHDDLGKDYDKFLGTAAELIAKFGRASLV
jgi:lysozyme